MKIRVSEGFIFTIIFTMHGQIAQKFYFLFRATDIRLSKRSGNDLRKVDATGEDSPSMTQLRLFRTSCPKIAVS